MGAGLKWHVWLMIRMSRLRDLISSGRLEADLDGLEPWGYCFHCSSCRELGRSGLVFIGGLESSSFF